MSDATPSQPVVVQGFPIPRPPDEPTPGSSSGHPSVTFAPPQQQQQQQQQHHSGTTTSSPPPPTTPDDANDPPGPPPYDPARNPRDQQQLPPPPVAYAGSADGEEERWSLPPGWTTAQHPSDGRMYYWERSTGRTSWVHPSAIGPAPAAAAATSSTPSTTTGSAGPSPFPEDNALGAGLLGAGLVGASASSRMRGMAGLWSRGRALLDRWTQKGRSATTSTVRNDEGRQRGRQRGQRGQRSQDEHWPTNSPAGAPHNRPDSHQCCAVLSCLLFPPLGICALLHSCRVKSAWDDGRHGDAVDHSRQAYNYAWFGCLVAICLFLYFWLRDADWDFKFDDWNFD